MSVFPGSLPSGDPEAREYRKETRELLGILWSIARYPTYAHHAHLAIATRIMTDPRTSPREQLRAAAILAGLQGKVLPALAKILGAREVVLDELGLPRSEDAAPPQPPQLVINIGVPQVVGSRPKTIDVEPISAEDPAPPAPPAPPPFLNGGNGHAGPYTNGKAHPGESPTEP